MADLLAHPPTVFSPIHVHPLSAITVGEFVAGIVDLVYAILVYSPGKPILIPQTIASGIMGMKSYSGGTHTAALGVVFHFVIALGAAIVYYIASRKIPLLLGRPILSGLIYGALVYGFMHLVVLPLSAAPHREMPVMYKLCECVEHCFGVGLPIALSIRYFSS